MNRLGINLIWTSLRDYLPGSTLVPHAHSFYHYVYVVSGDGNMQIGEESFRLVPEHIYLTPPGVAHVFSSAEQEQLITVELKFELHDPTLDKAIRALPHYIDTRQTDLVQLVTGLCREAEGKKAFGREILEAQVYVLLCYLQRFTHEETEKKIGAEAAGAELQPVFQYVRENLSRDMSLSGLAGVAHLEKSYFVKKFKRATGISPMQYVRKVKVEKALDLLAYSDMSVTQIAEALGFQSLSHFSSVILQLTGWSPKKHREYARNLKQQKNNNR